MNNEQKGSDLQNKQKGNHTSQKSKLEPTLNKKPKSNFWKKIQSGSN